MGCELNTVLISSEPAACDVVGDFNAKRSPADKLRLDITNKAVAWEFSQRLINLQASKNGIIHPRKIEPGLSIGRNIQLEIERL